MIKPKMRTENIQRVYWACTRPDHRHKTKEVAAKCIALWYRPRKLKKWTQEKLDELAKMHEEGMTFKAIAEHYGISLSRATQLYHEWWYFHGGQEKLVPWEDYDIRSTRTTNVLRSAGILKIEDLTKFTEAEIVAWKNCGPKTFQEIKEVLRKKHLKLKEEL